MNIVRASLSIRPAFQHLNGATQNPSVALEQRCLRTIPHAQVKQREELGLVLSDTERDYFREVCPKGFSLGSLVGSRRRGAATAAAHIAVWSCMSHSPN